MNSLILLDSATYSKMKLVRGNPRASQIVFWSSCITYNTSIHPGRILKKTPPRELDTHIAVCTHFIASAPQTLRHRWHCHGRVKSMRRCGRRHSCGGGTHAGQHATQGSCDGQGRSRLVLLLPVFSRRFHLVLADSFLRSFLRSPGIRPIDSIHLPDGIAEM